MRSTSIFIFIVTIDLRVGQRFMIHLEDLGFEKIKGEYDDEWL